MDLATAMSERLNAISGSFEERYGLDLSSLTWRETSTGPAVEGTVPVQKQLVIVRKAFEDWVEATLGPAPTIAVAALTELLRDDPRLPRRAEKPAKTIPLFARSTGDKLATEWIPADGRARVLGEGQNRVLLQLVDGSCGWAPAESVELTESPGETGPFVLTFQPGRVVCCGEGVLESLCDGARALAEAKVTYKLGGRTTSRGIDCSALIQNLMRIHASILFPRHSTEQMRTGTRVAKRSVEMGDLVFARTATRNHMHVGLALGGDEIGHACRLDGCVKVEHLDQFFERYRFLKARRVFGNVGGTQD